LQLIIVRHARWLRHLQKFAKRNLNGPVLGLLITERISILHSFVRNAVITTVKTRKVKLFER